MKYTIQNRRGEWWSGIGWKGINARKAYDSVDKLPNTLPIIKGRTPVIEWMELRKESYINENLETMATVYVERR